MNDNKYFHKEHFIAAHGDTVGDVHKYVSRVAGFLYSFYGFCFPKEFNVLDVGASDGFLGECLKKLGASYTGIDPIPDSSLVVEDTIRTHVNKTPGLSYDLVIFNHVLEHLLNPEDDIRDASFLTKPGGRIFIAVPEANSNWAYDYQGHYHLYNAAVLSRLLSRNGYFVLDSLNVCFRADNNELWVIGEKIGEKPE